MHCSNAGLLALWLILCTQGHEDFNLSFWHRRCEWVRVCFCACAYMHLCSRHVYAPAFICVFSLISPLYFHQITNSNELPLAIIAHFSTDPTRWGGQSVLLCAFVCIKMGREDYQNVQKQTQDVHCGLSGPLCAQISLCMLLQHPLHFYDKKKILVGC